MIVFSTLYVACAVVILFGAAIFFHELGHFWVARWLGMKVEEFAIGMGPKIFSRVRNGIVYSIRCIPAGGFVKLPQMITSETLEGKADEAVPPAPPWKKILVALAGPFMNVVFAFAIASLIYFVGLPVAVNPPIVGYVEPNSPEAQMGIQEGDRIISVNGEQVKTWDDANIFAATARSNVMPVVIERDGVRKTYSLTAQVNPIVGLKLLNLDPRDHPEVMEVEAGSPAEKAGLKIHDVVLAFGGVPIASRDQLIGLIHQRAGAPTELRVQRGPEKVSLSVTPGMDPATKEGHIGAALGTSSTQVYFLQKPGPTPWEQVSEVMDKTIRTISALIHSKQTGVGPKDLSGPVGIAAILGAWIKTDYRLALSFLVLLNINLAVINLLPIPVLDGGHIMMSLIEKIFRRPLSQRFVEYLTTGFAVLLLSFMLYVTYADIKRFPLFRAMFNSESTIQQAPDNSIPAPSRTQ
jgi:regulator of sigma E protease